MHDITNNTASDEIDLRNLFSIIKRNILSIIVFTVIVTALATLLVYSIKPQYTATATILIETQKKNTVSIEDVVGIDSSKQEYFLTQLEVLKSNALAERVIQELNLDELVEFNGVDPNAEPTWRDKLKQIYQSLPIYKAVFSDRTTVDFETQNEIIRQRVLNNFNSKLSVSAVGKTQLVRISFTSFNAKLAAKVANTVGQSYIEQNLDARITATQEASAWLTKRAEELRHQLERSESNLTRFLTQEGLIDSSGIDNLTTTELETLTLRLSEARDRRVAAESLYAVLKANKDTDISSLASVSEIANHPQVRGLLASETDIEERITELSKRYGPKHDKMVQAMAQHKAIQERSEKFLTQLANGIEKELQSARELESALRREMTDKKDEFQSIAVKRARYDVLKREVKTNRELYDLFLTRQKETNATSDFTPVNARFTDEALQPLVPSKPKKKLIVVLAALLGLMVAVAFSLLIEAFKQSFEKSEDVEEKLGIAPLGTIPAIKAKRFKKKDIPPDAFFDQDNASFAEAFRQIRTSLLLNQMNQSRKLLAVASSLPSEGKTTTAINIASSLATMEKVLLIDADLRKPSLAFRFGATHSQQGLTNHLLMNQDIDTCIFHDEQSNVDVLPAGMIPPNPLEVLSSDKFKALLDSMSKRYDRIVIDTPPALLFSDALVVSDLCGGAVVVIKANQTRSEQVKKTIGKFVQHKINLDGVILNRVAGKQHQGTGYYGEYNGYYGASAS